MKDDIVNKLSANNGRYKTKEAARNAAYDEMFAENAETKEVKEYAVIIKEVFVYGERFFVISDVVTSEERDAVSLPSRAHLGKRDSDNKTGEEVSIIDATVEICHSHPAKAIDRYHSQSGKLSGNDLIFADDWGCAVSSCYDNLFGKKAKSFWIYVPDLVNEVGNKWTWTCDFDVKIREGNVGKKYGFQKKYRDWEAIRLCSTKG